MLIGRGRLKSPLSANRKLRIFASRAPYHAKTAPIGRNITSDPAIWAGAAAAWLFACVVCAIVYGKRGPLVIFAASFIVLPATHSDASPLKVAERYVGMHERANTKALRSMLGVNPAKTPWCGAFAAFVVKKSGMKPPRSPLQAKAWSKWGKGVKHPRPGDVAVVRTKRGYHVTVVKSASKGCILGVGGNQSNRVRASRYCRVVAVRRGK